MTTLARRSLRLAVSVLSLVLLLGVAPAALAADGEMRWGLHVTLVGRWLDPAETEAFSTPFMVLYAIHDALVKPMPGGLMTPSLNARVLAGAFGLELSEQWDPKSPGHDLRVRQAASLAIDRQAVNQAETLGFSPPPGHLGPRLFPH